MKKNLMKLLCVSLIAGLCMVGCGGGATNNGQGGSNNENNPKVENGYGFKTNDTVLYMDMDLSTVVDKLGEPTSYFEEPSCAAQGTARIYTFPSYQLTTYPDGEIDRIANIILKDDMISTAEGADLSMTKQQIIDIYGTNYTETDTSITYQKDNMKLIFIFNGDALISI